MTIPLPVFCACGKIVRFAHETRCEDCYARDQMRFHGHSRRVKVHWAKWDNHADLHADLTDKPGTESR